MRRQQSPSEMHACGVQGGSTAHREPFTDSTTPFSCCGGKDNEHMSAGLYSDFITEPDSMIVDTPVSSQCSYENGHVVAAASSTDFSGDAVDDYQLKSSRGHEVSILHADS